VQAVAALPWVYRTQQMVGRPTTSRFRALLAQYVHVERSHRVLDIGCGIGNYRDSFAGVYVGCDLNAEYVQAARRRHGGQFDVMDACALTYSDDAFDHTVTIATTHHLNDSQLDTMIDGALRVTRADGALHVVDAVLPLTRVRWFKHAWFSMDAGRFPRTYTHLRAALEHHGRVVKEDLLPGPLHDCAYFEVHK